MAGRISIGDIVVNLIARTANFERNLSRATRKFRRTMGRWKRMGQDLTRTVSLPMAAVGVLAVRAATKFETAFAGIRKTVDATDAEFAKLEADIRKLATTTLPVAVEQIAAVGEVAGQLGYQVGNIKEFTRAMVDMGETTDLAARDAALQLARFQEIMQTADADVRRLGSTLVGLGNKFKAFESEILEVSMRLAGTGKQMGWTEAQVLALGTALRSVGIEAQMGGSAMSRTMIRMKKAVDVGGNALRDWADAADMSVDKFRTLFEEDAMGALVAFIDGLIALKAEGESVYQTLDRLGLGNIRITDTLTRLMPAVRTLKRALKESAKEWQANTALTEEAEKRYKTFAKQLRLLRNEINEFLITLGDELIPMLRELIQEVIVPGAKELTKLIKKFSELDENTKRLIVGLVAVAAVLPVIITGLAMLGLAVTGFGTGGLIAAGVLAALTGGLAAFGDKLFGVNKKLEYQTKTVVIIATWYKHLAAQLAMVGIAMSGGFGRAAKGKSLGDLITDWVHKFQNFEDTIQSWGDTFADEMTNAIMGAQSFADAMKNAINSIISDLIRLMIQLSITQPLVQALQGAFGLTPTYGVTKDPSGSAGAYDPPIGPVQGFGGGSTVQVFNNATSTGPARVEQSRGPMGRPMVKVYIEDAVEEAIAGGRFDSTLGRTFGMRRRGVRR